MRLFSDLLQSNFPNTYTETNNLDRVKACIRANQEPGCVPGDRWIGLRGEDTDCELCYISDWVVANRDDGTLYAYTWFLNGESYQRIITDYNEQERYLANCPDDRP